jgi:hypothetical protein
MGVTTALPVTTREGATDGCVVSVKKQISITTTHLFPRPRRIPRLGIGVRNLRRIDHARKLTETPRSIQPGKQACPKKGGGEFKEPTIVLQSNDAGKAEAVKSPTDMPVPGDSGGVDANDLEDESASKGVCETLCLLDSSGGTVCPIMQSANGEGGRGGGRESQLLLNDKVSAEGNDKEYSKESSGDGKCE